MSWEQSPCSWHFINTAFIRSSLLFIKVPFLDVMCHFCPRKKGGVYTSRFAALFWCCQFTNKGVISAHCLKLPSQCWSWFRFRLKLHRLKTLQQFWLVTAIWSWNCGFCGAKTSLSSLPISSIWLIRELLCISPHQGQISNSVYMFVVEGVFRVMFFA